MWMIQRPYYVLTHERRSKERKAVRSFDKAGVVVIRCEADLKVHSPMLMLLCMRG